MATLQAKICNLLGFDPKRHNWKTEVLAGITSFLTMSYILAVNPSMFGILEGMPQGAVFTTTTLVEKPCARDPRSPVPLTLAVQNSLTL